MSLDVLIADQDVELAQLYCRFLASKGLTAETASHRLECLRMIRWRNPGLLKTTLEAKTGFVVTSICRIENTQQGQCSIRGPCG